MFTPSAGEVEWARGKTQDDQHLLALLVWLKAYQRLGYFPKLADVPAVVAEHIRSVVGLPEGVMLAEAAERSAKRHRSFVRTRMGVTYDAAGVRTVAAEAIRKAAQAKDNPADLINVALEELVRAQCELPGYTTLDELTKKIRTEVNRGFFTLVSGRVDAAARARLARLLVVDPVTRRSEYDGLKDVAQAASLGKFKGRLAFLRDLDALGPTEAWLQGVSPGKVAHFAGEARVTDVADLRKVLDEDKRLTLIVSLLHTARTGVRDDVVTMFCKRIAAIHKKGRDQLEALREIHRAESERLLGVFGDVLDGVREASPQLSSSPMTRLRMRPALRAGHQGTWPSGPGGGCSRLWSRRVDWRRWQPRTRRSQPITATTTYRCWRRTTARTAPRCSRW